jgi:hypothetical protein
MNKKRLRLLKNASWFIAALCMGFLIQDNTKNNPLTAAAFIFIVAGIIFNVLEDRTK